MSNIVKANEGMTQLIEVSRMLAEGNMFTHPITGKALSQGEIFSIVEYGRELGLEPVMALQNISVVKGRLCVGGSVMLGLAINRGIQYEIQEENNQGCRILFKRDGQAPYVAAFTKEDADNAGLLVKDNWKRYPKEMYKWRAVAKGLRVVASDVLAGLYLPEELDNIPDKTIDINPDDFMDGVDFIEESMDKTDDKPDDDFFDVGRVESADQTREPNYIMIPLDDEPDTKPTIQTEDRITENQMKALRATMHRIGLDKFESSWKIHLKNCGYIDESISLNTLSKSKASELIAMKDKLLHELFLQQWMNDDLLDLFARFNKSDKIRILNNATSWIKDIGKEKIIYNDSHDDQRLSDTFSLVLKTLQNEEVNTVAAMVEAKGMTTQEAVDLLESQGMEPKIEKVIDLSPQPDDDEPFF